MVDLLVVQMVDHLDSRLVLQLAVLSADLLAVLLADWRELPQVDLLVDQKADLLAES